MGTLAYFSLSLWFPFVRQEVKFVEWNWTALWFTNWDIRMLWPFWKWSCNPIYQPQNTISHICIVSRFRCWSQYFIQCETLNLCQSWLYIDNMVDRLKGLNCRGINKNERKIFKILSSLISLSPLHSFWNEENVVNIVQFCRKCSFRWWLVYHHSRFVCVLRVLLFCLFLVKLQD